MMDDSLVRCVVGPIGSGKSMGMIMELLRRARQQAPQADGVRYTRAVIVRNTMSQIRLSVLNDIREYLSPMIKLFTTDSTIQIRAPLEDGTSINSDWIMIPLDSKEDQQRLLSLQLTFAWVNELREVPIEIVAALLGRLGRFPSRANGGPSFHGLIADTNPWSTSSPFHERFVLKPVPGWKLFHQPGYGPYAENLDNLPPNYYDALINDHDAEWTRVHVFGEWGSDLSGQAVYRRSFDPKTHVRDISPVLNPGRPVQVSMDFGRTPCALITQVDNYGRLIVYEELTADDEGLHQFVQERLKPKLMMPPYYGRHVFVVADPAGGHKSQVNEESPFDVLRAHGMLAYPAPSNDIPPRLLAVEKLLRQTYAGEPALQISRVGCPTLVRALGAEYKYKRRKDGSLEDRPEKSHPWSDVADALGYGAMAVGMDLTARVLQRYRPRPQRPVITAAAWT